MLIDCASKPYDFILRYLLPVILLLFLLSWIIEKGFAIKCYQCSTEKDGKGVDNCGAYKAFNYSQHIAVDCMGEEAVTPGTFCFKSIQQGPRGFIWDGRWRSVIRRCAQVFLGAVIGVIMRMVSTGKNATVQKMAVIVQSIFRQVFCSIL
ncbi:hypothetical protein NH340_JMT00648 [Sarcoptes scabiei]|nr:hypothetical protein NH340_JMT00648 [Sarcoptes scabiei]